jgi:hypothetical protein
VTRSRILDHAGAKMGTQTNTKQKVQFEFTSDTLRRLDGLKEEVEAYTRAEVVRNALKLYEWFVAQAKDNRIINVEDQVGNSLRRIEAKELL